VTRLVYNLFRALHFLIIGPVTFLIIQVCLLCCQIIGYWSCEPFYFILFQRTVLKLQFTFNPLHGTVIRAQQRLVITLFKFLHDLVDTGLLELTAVVHVQFYLHICEEVSVSEIGKSDLSIEK